MAFSKVGLTPLQMAQKKYWQDMGTCERVRMQLEAMPYSDGKYDAIEYVVRAKRIIKERYAEESARLKEEAKHGSEIPF